MQDKIIWKIEGGRTCGYGVRVFPYADDQGNVWLDNTFYLRKEDEQMGWFIPAVHANRKEQMIFYKFEKLSKL